MDTESFILGVGASLTATVIYLGFGKYRRYSLKQDIENLELEKQVLERMKKSSIELNRVSFLSIFVLFSIVALANTISVFAELVKYDGISVSLYLALILWAVAFSLAVFMVGRYKNLKEYKKAMDKLDQKISKKNEKLVR